MAGMKMSGDNGTEKALPPAGHDMAGMKTSKPSAEKAAPSAGHDMAEMKSSELGADKASPSGHDMTGMKKAEPDAKASPGSHDMAEMKKSGDKSVAPDEEEHLMGVVTRVDGTALTVILEKGSSAIILTDKQTVFERGEAKATLKGIKTGERLVVYATPKDGKWLARMVKLSAPPAAEAKGADVGDAGSSTQHDGMKMPDAKNTQPAQEFTCPMHPEVRSPTPGKCPKCGMKLQPVGSK